MVASVIRTDKLCKRFSESKAVDDFDLVVPGGVFYGLLGPNGAGKSTTVGMLTGMMRQTSGTIELFGTPFDPDDPAFKTRMGVVTEEPALFERLRGREQLLFTGRMFGLTREEAGRRADELLELLKLDRHPRTLIADYSRGMRKKLGIACSLIHSPSLLFFDEPFEGVDASSADTIRKVLTGLTGRGATILLTTHILEVAQKICQRVGIINQGRLVFEVEVADLAEQGRDLAEVFRSVVGGNEDPELPGWLFEGCAGD